ncbi:MAG TPA: hypothetical protein VMR06_03750 [Dokdonella sp.]|uniref:hypothetical protein n=1 Tax=Dokdonella sp. TaxID=2291710 RepID=UPI002CC2F662|nr:hypothetical protein [Dokdonella sp.]HUD41092.1 hypothetical protein [Dokdonella sp.]
MNIANAIFEMERREGRVIVYSIASREFSDNFEPEIIGVVEIDLDSKSASFSPKGPWEKYGGKISAEVERLILGPAHIPVADEFLKLSAWIVRIVARVRHDLAN